MRQGHIWGRVKWIGSARAGEERRKRGEEKRETSAASLHNISGAPLPNYVSGGSTSRKRPKAFIHRRQIQYSDWA